MILIGCRLYGIQEHCFTYFILIIRWNGWRYPPKLGVYDDGINEWYQHTNKWYEQVASNKPDVCLLIALINSKYVITLQCQQGAWCYSSVI